MIVMPIRVTYAGPANKKYKDDLILQGAASSVRLCPFYSGWTEQQFKNVQIKPDLFWYDNMEGDTVGHLIADINPKLKGVEIGIERLDCGDVFKIKSGFYLYLGAYASKHSKFRHLTYHLFGAKEYEPYITVRYGDGAVEWVGSFTEVEYVSTEEHSLLMEACEL